jgi:hypothetical protein
MEEETKTAEMAEAIPDITRLLSANGYSITKAEYEYGSPAGKEDFCLWTGYLNLRIRATDKQYANYCEVQDKK